MKTNRGMGGAATFLAALIWATAAVAAWTECVVLTTDYSTFGGVSIMQRQAPWAIQPDVETVGGDPIARWHEGLVYVVNRGGANNVQVLDPQQGYTTILQFSVGAGRNPQDIAFDSEGDAYISCYDEAVLLRVDKQTGAIITSWSTEPFADSDGLPETAWMETVDDLLYIVCQRLDRDNWYAPTDASYLAIFDMASEQWVDAEPSVPGVQGIVLTGTNPFAQLELDATLPQLRVCCVGYWGLLDGGIETVDLVAQASLGFEITEQELGGDVLGIATALDGWRFAIISNPSFETAVVRYAPATGDVAMVDQATGYVHADLAFDGTFMVYVADRTLGNHGLRVFDAVGATELTSAPLSAGLPPFRVELPAAGPTAVAVPSAAGLRLLAPWPNPSNPATEIRVQSEPGQSVRLSVVDLRGHRVRAVTVIADGAGEGRFRFDGTDNAGRILPAGVYRVIAEGGGAFAARSLTLVR